MKKKFITVVAALALLVSTSFANNTTEPSQDIKTEFNRLFTNSTNVKWQMVSNFYMATFKQGEQYLTAYFNPLGKMEAVSRNISTTALPLMLQKGLEDRRKNNWITETAELVNNNGTQYYITLENANTKTIYQSSGSEWTVYKSSEK